MTRNRWLHSLIVVIVCNACVAQEAGRPSAERKVVGEYGPFLQCTVMRKLGGGKREVVSLKGVVIKLPGEHPAAVCFDTDTLTLTSAWVGGFLDFTNTMMVNHKGTELPALAGAEMMTASGPGWAGDHDFIETRPDRLGPLPRGWGTYEGLYTSGDRVVISYAIRDCDVLETYELREVGQEQRIRRVVRVGKSEWPLTLLLKDSGGTTVHVINPPAGAVAGPGGDQRLVLKLPPHDLPRVFAVEYGRGGGQAVVTRGADVDDPAVLVGRAPVREVKELDLRGVVDASQGAYALDRIPLPESNPWNSWMRLTAFDFLQNGRAAVSTLNGDVWLVSGLDASLANVSWTRFATGMYEPMGLKIVDGIVHVLGRDQITRLHDTNNDGEADFYENFNNSGVVNPSYHGFAFELQTDSQGRFYYTRTGHRAVSGYPGHGCVIKVLNRSEHEVVATGLRAPNGLGVSPFGEIAVADNQGNWVPTTRLDVFKPKLGGEPPFLGYLPQHHRGEAPTECPPPMLWIPHKLDPSAGSAVWVSGDKWGPFLGQMAHTSFGRASLLVVLPDEEYRQAAVVRMPLNFDTGIMRAKFHPIDGQLYVAGVGGGWQAGGPRDGGFYRVRYTGKAVHLPNRFRVEKNGVRLSFPSPLDPKSAADPDNYGVEQWSYKWTEAYGSPEHSVEDAEKKGRDEVEVKSVTVSEDRRSVLLELGDFKPVMQMLIQTNIKAADGTEIETEVYATVNRVPE